MLDVLCLRPQSDFLEVGVEPPQELTIAYRGPMDADVKQLLGEARALVLPSAGPKLADELFSEAGRLQLVQYTGAGWDRISREVWQSRHWDVCNVPGVNAKDVAEYVVLAAGILLRRLKMGDRLVWEKQYQTARTELAAERALGFSGLTVGIIGLGHIGMAVATLMQQFDTHILYYDPVSMNDELAATRGWVRAGLHELLGQSDIVTLHVPATNETKGLLGLAEIARLKPSAILVQASRGGIVDQAAALTALRQGQISGLALDVYEREPLPDTEAFLNQQELRDRLLLSPHVGGVTRQAAQKLYRTAWDNVRGVLLLGEVPKGRCG